MADLVRWTFTDDVDLTSYTFEINPKQGGSPGIKKRVGYEYPCAPDGLVIRFEGMDEVQELAWDGTILTQEHYMALYTWADLRHQIRLLDDLGRDYWIYIAEFVPTRVRAASHPWKHTYTAKATVLDWHWPTP